MMSRAHFCQGWPFELHLDLYTEGVRQFQPRVELWQPWDHECHLVGTRNPERVAPAARKPVAIPSGLRQKQSPVLPPRVAKAQPWAEIGEHLRCNPAGIRVLTQSLSALWSFNVNIRNSLEQRSKLKLHTAESHG